jgi:phosphoribosyl 1,2-cyclic phosphate phosphodiesterase
MKIKFTGTGDGRGIPVIGCRCRICTLAREAKGKNRRRRVSVIVTNQSNTILLDTPPSIRQMLNEEQIFQITAIFLSHKHFDHVGGITEFEYWPEKIPVYGNVSVLGNFEITERLYRNCEFHVLYEKKSVKLGGITVKPFEVPHVVPTNGLVFHENHDRIVHFSDRSKAAFTDYEKRLIKGSNIAVFHAPSYDQAEDHIDVVSVMDLARKYPSTRFVISHIGHNNFPHEVLEEKLAPFDNITVAYDGLVLEV